MSARAVTPTELAYLRTNNQFVKLGMAIIVPDVVLVARADGVPASNDEVQYIPYTDLTYGTVSDVKYGQTVYVGSTANGHEYGMVRANSAAASGSASGSITIGITSEITWVDDAYITVTNEYSLWPKTAKMLGISMVCDDDKPYVAQHTLTAPAPVMGPDLVFDVSSGAVTHTFSAASSWVPYLSSIAVSSAEWSCSSASGSYTASGSTVYTKDFTFHTPGTYIMECICTASGSAGSASTTGHRLVYCYNQAAPPVTQFTLDSISGDWQSGGWSCSVTMYGEADRANVRDRAKVLLFADTYYGGSRVVLGPDGGSENMLLNGWIDGQSILVNPELNTIEFRIHGAQWWLDKIASWPAGLRGHLNKTPTNWSEWKCLTYDAFMWHILRWRCTAAEVMDVFPSNITTRMVGADAPWGTIWSQFSQVADSKHLIHPAVNRLGQLYNQKDPNAMTAAERTSIPTVMEVTKQDWQGDFEVERRIVPDVGMMDTTGMFWNGKTAGGFRGGSWGTALGRFGRMERRTELYIPEPSGQESVNTLAGILLGKANNQYPRMTYKMGGFNPFFDIAPVQYGQFSIAAADSPLNMAASGSFIPRSVSHEWDSRSGSMYTNMTGEGVSNIEHGFVLPFYTGPQFNIPPAIPKNPWTPRKKGPRPVVAATPCTAATAANNGPFTLPGAATIQSYGGDTTFTQYYHGQVRNSGATYKTSLTVLASFFYDASGSGAWQPATSGSAAMMTVQGIDASGSPVVNATMGTYAGGSTGVRTYTFAPTISTEVVGFLFTANARSKAVIQWTMLSNICRYFDPARVAYYTVNFDFAASAMGWIGTRAPMYGTADPRWAAGYLEGYPTESGKVLGVEWDYTETDTTSYSNVVMTWDLEINTSAATVATWLRFTFEHKVTYGYPGTSLPNGRYTGSSSITTGLCGKLLSAEWHSYSSGAVALGEYVRLHQIGFTAE